MRGFAVTDLSLSHFRSHRATRLQFDGRPVAIVGANGAGKTNILEAVSLLSPGRGLRRAEAGELPRRPEALGWKVSAAVQGARMAHEIETGAAAGEAREVRIDGKAATQAALGRVLRVVWLVPAMDRLWIEAAEGRRRFLDRLTLSFAPDHAEAVLGYEKAMRDRNRMLKDGVTDARWYGALEGQMATAAAAIAANRAHCVTRLMAAQGAAETAFPAADIAVTGPEGEAVVEAAALPELWATTRARDVAAGRTLLGPHRADLAAVYREKGVAAAQCSTGEQKALLVSLILSNARALTADLGATPVVLLDEVAAHLDAGRRAALYDEICALGCQAIMTGTEGDLFAGLGARGQMVTVVEDGGISRVEAGGAD
ncbi:MAG: DNA replication/repair protein RecF [Paracoccaceae bacterium]